MFPSSPASTSHARSAAPDSPSRNSRPTSAGSRRRECRHSLTYPREDESAIGKPAPAERRVAPLLDDVDGDRDLPVELVALEISDDMRHEPGEMPGAVTIGDDNGETFRVTRIGRAVFVWQVHEPHPRILADSRLIAFGHSGYRRKGALLGAKQTGRGAYGSPA